jgi:hypothetical protein
MDTVEWAVKEARGGVADVGNKMCGGVVAGGLISLAWWVPPTPTPPHPHPRRQCFGYIQCF